MASGFIYIRDTEKTSVTKEGSPVIVNKLNLPFGIKVPFLPKIPIIDVGSYYDTLDNVVYNPTPMPLYTYDTDSGTYDVTIDTTEYSVIFTPINEEETEFGMILMGK